MFKPHITKAQLCKLLEEMGDDDFARFLYCQHIVSTHLAVGQFEHMLISAMWMCDRVRVEKALGPDMQRWEQMLAKQRLLQVSTIGSLITILSRHDIAEADITYLTWVKDKRDHFVHRLYHEGAWPAELDGRGAGGASD